MKSPALPSCSQCLFRYMKTTVLLATVTLSLVALAATAQNPPPQQPERRPPPPNDPRPRTGSPAQKHSLAQAVSDEAQLHTIAFSGLAFITGDFGASTFIPPGKVCDFFGFQYMRDIDAARKGHNPMFLNRVAANVLK